MIFFLSLLFLLFFLNTPNRIIAASSSDKSSSKFDHIETPPMPGEVRRGSGQRTEETESLPPAVKEMDERIKKQTEVLRRGITRSEPEPESESESTSGPATSQESESDSRSQTIKKSTRRALPQVTKSDRQKQPMRTKTPVTVRKDTRPSTRTSSMDKNTSTVRNKSVASQKLPKDPQSAESRDSATGKPVSVKTESQVKTDTPYVSRPAGGKVHDLTFFLKRLIIFVIIAGVGFLLMRKYVFKT